MKLEEIKTLVIKLVQSIDQLESEQKTVSNVMPISNEPLLCTPDEAATLLSYSKSHIYRLMDKGELPTIGNGKTTRILRTGLKEFVERKLVEKNPQLLGGTYGNKKARPR